MNPDHFKLVSERWSKNPGKSTLSIFDFPPSYSVRFSEHGNKILQNLYINFKTNFGIDAFHRKTRMNFYSIDYYLRNESKSISIKFLIKLKEILAEYLPDFDFTSIECEIRYVLNKRNCFAASFPLNLETPFFAYVLGLSFDSGIQDYCFANTNHELILKAKSMFEHFGFYSGSIKDRTGGQIVQVGKIGTKFLELAGFIINVQIKANNPLPEWAVYSNDLPFVKALISAIIDSEGNINNKSLRICQNTLHQNINFPHGYRDFPKQNVSSTSFIYIVPPEQKKEIFQEILNNPPLMLISLQILFARLGIHSSLAIVKIYVKRTGELCSAWHLQVFSKKNLELVYELTKEHLIKKSSLEKTLKSYKRDYVSGPNKRVEDFIKLIKFSGKPVFTSRDLITLNVRKRKTIQNTIPYLQSKGVVKLVGFEGKLKKWELIAT